MATYPVKHKDTGEQKEVKLSVHEWEQWKTDNPEWIRDWSDPDTVPGSGEVGDPISKIYRSHPGWKEVMSGVKKAGARNPSITQKY